MPRYSFQQHFGSSLTGTQSYRKKRSICQVISKTFEGIVTDVKSHERRGSVSAMQNIKYGAHNHISHLKQTNALKT
jgi:hypothetical protein